MHIVNACAHTHVRGWCVGTDRGKATAPPKEKTTLRPRLGADVNLTNNARSKRKYETDTHKVKVTLCVGVCARVRVPVG